jgi:crotonobetainyl-CoA:carnitine CoA-transferase CaiB-like acyl-CoA transferase
VSGWTAQRTDAAIAEELQAAGIAAGALQDCENLLEHDPQIAGRNALVALEHPILGRFGHMNTPLRFSQDRFEPFLAPAMGEHSEIIAGEICGLDKDAIARLREQGVFK